MPKLDTWQYGRELSDKYGEKVDIAGHVSDTESARELIADMVETALSEHLPAEEKLDHIAVRFDPWVTPKVTVWCKASGFNYHNSEVKSDTVWSYGRSYDFKVDVRPF